MTILAELSTNARISQTELSSRMGLSSTAIARRQRALEDDGYITGYQATLDLNRLPIGRSRRLISCVLTWAARTTATSRISLALPSLVKPTNCRHSSSKPCLPGLSANAS
ncbi:winged helix-turn-helix transcriptional regulator [Bradyrhizobium sp. 191]|uniref:Lrp/AsnC family transcriptional regulator n=1 Tax=Bradyrhizobium sp. 191 TaxID=2782659 RepID=UPI001FFEDC25|nr:winged helix-turn-helix transcriptional regulator [Bradyrhizobium sp. 191]